MVARSATLATLAQISPTTTTAPPFASPALPSPAAAAAAAAKKIPDAKPSTQASGPAEAQAASPALSQAPAPAAPAPQAPQGPIRTHSSSTASSHSQAPSRVSSRTTPSTVTSTLPSTVPSAVPSSANSPKLAPALDLKPSPAPAAPLSSVRNHSSERMSTATAATANDSVMGMCGASGASGAGSAKPGPKDELDRLGYLYSLRVAALHHRLKTPSTASPKVGMAALGSPTQHQSHDSTSSAPNTGFSSFRTPDPAEEPLPIRRKKSALSLRLGRKDELKLPKDFLAEFWGILAREQGDIGWTQAVRTFLGMLQQKNGTGTKTSAGANMREIPTLLATFTTCLPPAGMGSAPVPAHQSHFLTLLYNALPKSAYFFASSNEKDKDLLFRLRAEVQSLIHPPDSPMMPTSAKSARFSPELAAHGLAAKAGLGFIPPSPVSPVSSANPITPTSPMPPPTPPRRTNRPPSDAGSVRRKPIPAWTGHGQGLDNLVEAVGAVWDVPEETLVRDAEELDRYALEKLYLDDLKRSLTSLSRQYQGDQRHRARHAELSRELGDLLSNFPELAIPTSPHSFGQSSQETYFTPPRASAVLTRLSRRAEGSSSRRARELVDRCRKIWGVEGRGEKEREVETLVRQWDAAVGGPSEVPIGKRLAEAVVELAGSLDADEEIPRGLEDLQVCLMEHLSRAVIDIFPISADTLPPRPPTSVLPLLRSAPSVLVNSPRAVQMLDSLADELRGAAVSEYVAAVQERMGGMESHLVGTRTAPSGKDAVVEGFERVAEWIEMEIANIEKVWPTNGPINPAGIIISKQLPLLLAELQVLETAGGEASDVFALYEVTSRLLGIWERLCPGASGREFDIDAFFEPHVITWLRQTEATETHQWVARTVGMDQWLPEGEGRHSQSVVDLFEFIRSTTQVVRDLPVGEYKRAVYMVDLARTASTALEQYAGTLLSLFMAEVAPSKGHAKDLPGGKAGAWLAKGRHAYDKLDAKIEHRRGRDRAGFMVPPEALVKLTNMGAARQFIDDLSRALEADQSARVLREHKLAPTAAPRQVFLVQVVRGQHILTRDAKPADAFVTITDAASGSRLFKSRTQLETEDPKWEQSFELSVSLGTPKSLEVAVYDRQLVGRHDVVGTRTLRLDAAAFDAEPTRDLVLPLSPRGILMLRVSAVARERYDVGYHLTASKRALERTASDMQSEIVDRLSAYLRTHLCADTLAAVTKPLRDRRRGRVALSDAEIDASLAPVLEYLDENLATIASTSTPHIRAALSRSLWERTVDTLLALLIPPLSDRPSHRTPLSPPEVDVVFKWLQALKTFFNAGGAGVPLHHLQSGVYRDMLMLAQVLDLPTPALRERVAAAVRAACASGSRGIMGLRSLSLQQDAAADARRVDEDNERVAEVLLRVLRMRALEDDFLVRQVEALTRARVERGGAGVV